jgi:aminomethyltransferase
LCFFSWFNVPLSDKRVLFYFQGPLAAPALQHLTKEDLSKIYFGEFRILDINGAQCFLTRTGYASFLK